MGTRYEELMRLAGEHVQRYDAFEERGRSAVHAALTDFVTYLEAPQGTCRAWPPDVEFEFDETRTFRPEEWIRLRDDGRFAGCVAVVAGPHLGPFLRFTFYVRVDGDSLVFQSGDKEPGPAEFRVKTPSAEALTPLFEHVLQSARALFNTAPERLASGDTSRPIGFINLSSS